MKTKAFLCGLTVACGVVTSGRCGGGSQNVKTSRPSRGDSPSVSTPGQSPTPTGPGVDSARRGYLDDVVEILSVTEEKPDAEGKRKVTVRVRYVLIHYATAVVNLGFNLKSATKFLPVKNQQVQRGSEEVELAAIIAPVKWGEKNPFKLYVGLTAEPHPGRWSLLAAVSQVMKPAPPWAAPEGAGK